MGNKGMYSAEAWKEHFVTQMYKTPLLPHYLFIFATNNPKNKIWRKYGKLIWLPQNPPDLCHEPRNPTLVLHITTKLLPGGSKHALVGRAATRALLATQGPQPPAQQHCHSLTACCPLLRAATHTFTQKTDCRQHILCLILSANRRTCHQASPTLRSAPRSSGHSPFSALHLSVSLLKEHRTPLCRLSEEKHTRAVCQGDLFLVGLLFS